jgi:serine/threonine-protein kinase
VASGIPFGRYRLQKRLARGGMAEVFLAQLQGAEGFERRVAIKRILPHLSDSDEFRGMFMDEARLAAMLSHPNVVHVYDFGREGDHYFIAMEFVDGVALSRLINEASRHRVGWHFAARIAADVCAGLHYAHHLADGDGRPQALVHRDVSPQNILVTWDGVVKLVDFGIAKAAWSAGRTRPGMVKGKWTYMSPEQCEGRKLDGRSDIFRATAATTPSWRCARSAPASGSSRSTSAPTCRASSATSSGGPRPRTSATATRRPARCSSSSSGSCPTRAR